MDETKETAYLRELKQSKQCELLFSLKTEVQNVGPINEEVKAHRQLTDTVDSLLQHTVNKIKKTLLDKSENNTNVEIPISLINSTTEKAIPASMVLENLINSTMNDLEFRIFDQEFYVVINAPLMKEIKLPRVLYAHSVIQPKLSYLFTDLNTCQFSWFKSEDKNEWTLIASTNRYKLTESDVGHFLKLVVVPCSKTVTGPPSEVVSESRVVQMGDLPKCPFEERHKFSMEKLKENSFRMVSYNVLSNRYTERIGDFPYCPPTALAIDYRKQLIAKELRGYNADIICLQEVDSNVFGTYYKEVFQKEGYMGFYHKKGNKISEGLACFFNKSRFKKIEDHQIIYSTQITERLFTYLSNFLKSNPDLRDCFNKQMTSLHVTVLQMKTSKGRTQTLIIGNTHLFYHPDHELVRMVQINLATTYLQNLTRKYTQNGVAKVILCGDFNSVPTSGIYEYMTLGKINKNHRVFQNCKNKPDLFHKFQFTSACEVPKYTNYTDTFKGCLDYIFVERNKMRVKSMVPFPTEEELAQYAGLPNEVYPSDHLALVVDLEIVN